VQKWAYFGFPVNSTGQVAGGPYAGQVLSQALAIVGNEGWELVLSFPGPGGNAEFVFKRPA
jgi:hypothetical protein